MKLIDKYYEGTCICGEKWQMPRGGTVVLKSRLMLNELLASIEGLYINYYEKGKTPGVMDAPRIWKGLMEQYKAYRESK